MPALRRQTPSSPIAFRSSLSSASLSGYSVIVATASRSPTSHATSARAATTWPMRNRSSVGSASDQASSRRSLMTGISAAGADEGEHDEPRDPRHDRRAPDPQNGGRRFGCLVPAALIELDPCAPAEMVEAVELEAVIAAVGEPESTYRAARSYRLAARAPVTSNLLASPARSVIPAACASPKHSSSAGRPTVAKSRVAIIVRLRRTSSLSPSSSARARASLRAPSPSAT